MIIKSLIAEKTIFILFIISPYTPLDFILINVPGVVVIQQWGYLDNN
jgi:hypothetical protein